MPTRWCYFVLAAMLPLVAHVSCYAQAEPAAIGPTGLQLEVGAGLSENLMDYSPGSRMLGVAAWADWRPFAASRYLHRISVEAEGRDVNFARPSNLPHLRTDTGEGGLKFTLVAGRKGLLYAKGLAGIGSLDLPPGSLPVGTHKTEMIYAYGEGFNWRFNRMFTLNVDLETQQWRDIFPDHSGMSPAAITVGISHSFWRSRHEIPAFQQ